MALFDEQFDTYWFKIFDGLEWSRLETSNYRYDESISLPVKFDKLYLMVKRLAKDDELIMDYLREFAEAFDENLELTVQDVLDEWKESGEINELFDETLLDKINNEIYELDQSKLDVDGTMDIGWERLDQDVRDKITGDTPASFPSEDSVGNIHVIDNSIQPNKLTNKPFDFTQTGAKQENLYIESVDSAGNITLTWTNYYFIHQFPLPERGVIHFKTSDWANGRMFAIVKSDGICCDNGSFPFNYGDLKERSWVKCYDSHIEIDVANLYEAYPDAQTMIIEWKNEDLNSYYIHGYGTHIFDSDEWFGGVAFDKLYNVPPYLNQSFNLIEQKDTQFFPEKTMPYQYYSTVPHASVVMDFSDYVSTIRFTVPNRGVIRLPKFELRGNDFIVMCDSSNTPFVEYSYAFSTGEQTQAEWLTFDDDYFYFDVAGMREDRPDVHFIYLSIINDILRDIEWLERPRLLIEAIGAFTLDEIFNWVTDVATYVTNESIPKQEITVDKIKPDILDMSVFGDVFEGKYIDGAEADGTPLILDTARYFTVRTSLPKTGVVQFSLSDWDAGRIFMLTDSNDKLIDNLSFPPNLGDVQQRGWFSMTGEYMQLDLERLNQSYDLGYLYVEFRNEDLPTYFVRGLHVLSVDDTDWSSGSDYNTLRNTPPYLENPCDLMKMPESQLFNSRTMPRQEYYDGTHDSVVFETLTRRSVLKFKLPRRGSIKFPKYELAGNDFIVLSDENDKPFIEYSNNFTNGIQTQALWLTNDDEYFYINVNGLLQDRTDAVYMYLELDNETCLIDKDFKVECSNGFTSHEVLPALFDETLGEKSFVLPPYYPLLDNLEAYISLQQVNKNGDVYQDNDIQVRQQTFTTTMQNMHRIPNAETKIYLGRYKDGYEIQKDELVVKRIPSNAGSGNVNVMFLGDSLIENNETNADGVVMGIAPYTYELFQSDETMTISLTGTRGNTSYPVEGRSGWSLDDYFNQSEYNGATNAFFNPETETFDLNYYLENNPPSETIDIVVLNSGINDANANLGNDKFIAYYDQIIEQFKSYNPSIKFVLTISPALSEVENFKFRTLYRRYKLISKHEALYSAFANKESSGIFLCPMNLNVDPVWDMRYEWKYLNKFTTDDRLMFISGTDGTHPSYEIGYQKCSDIVYSTIKGIYAM